MCNHARRESPPEDAHHKRLRKDHARVPLQLQPKLVFLNQSDHQEALDIFARDHGKRSSRNDADSQTQDGEQFRVVLLCPSIIHTSSTMRHFTKYPFHLFMAFIPPGFWISLDDLSKKVDTILLLSAIGFVTIADAHELIGSAKDEKEFSWIGGEDGHIWSETARQALPAHKSLLRSTVAGQMVLGSWSSAKDALNATFGRPTALPDLQVGELDETESMGVRLTYHSLLLLVLTLRRHPLVMSSLRSRATGLHQARTCIASTKRSRRYAIWNFSFPRIVRRLQDVNSVRGSMVRIF